MTNPALTPSQSCVVEASAGTGKTWTLVARILRLLLSGSQPGEILAITFTRLAAREMEQRLREWLGFLATAADNEALSFLEKIDLTPEQAREFLPSARLLMEQWLLASPTITLCTYDAWYQNLLSAAPLSSSLPRDRVVAQDNEILLAQAWRQLLERHPDQNTPVGASLEWLLRHEKLLTINELLKNFARSRTEWLIYTEGQNPVDSALNRLTHALDVTEGTDVEGQFLSQPQVKDWIAELARYLGTGSPTLQKHAGELVDAMNSATPISALRKTLFTGTGNRRVNIANFVANSSDFNLISNYNLLIELIVSEWNKKLSVSSIELNRHALTVAHAWLLELASCREALHQFDHTDVHWHVRELLNHPDQAAHLLCRLDTRYRHILLDEFQDTSPLQWQILEKWLENAKEGGTPPTVMLVGDPKQSIYRFRKADVRIFERAALFLVHEWGAQRVTLSQSWRSGATIMAEVNKVFGPAYEGLPVHFKDHTPHPDVAISQVKPLFLGGTLVDEPSPESSAADSPPNPDFRNPLTTPRHLAGDDQEADDARAFASMVKEMVTHWQVEDIPGGPTRPARFSDILVLSRQKNFMRPYRDALREAGIPFLIEQRGELLESIEISDLAALLESLVDPYNNLSLAHCLRSPIFNLVDSDLISLAGNAHWWDALACSPNPRFQEIAQTLAQWREWSRTLPVHDCLERIIHQGQLLQRYERAAPAALQAAARANVEAFLALSLELDSGRYPSLPRFLQELADQKESEVDAPDEGRLGNLNQGVRFMTIHGAKGLESPILCLIDPSSSTSKADSQRRWLVRWDPESPAPNHFSLLPSSSGRSDAHNRLVEPETGEKQLEDLNLLYVAMTRARQYLVILGNPESPWTKRLQETLSFRPLSISAAPAGA